MLAICHTWARSQPLMLSAPITFLMLPQKITNSTPWSLCLYWRTLKIIKWTNNCTGTFSFSAARRARGTRSFPAKVMSTSGARSELRFPFAWCACDDSRRDCAAAGGAPDASLHEQLARWSRGEPPPPATCFSHRAVAEIAFRQSHNLHWLDSFKKEIRFSGTQTADGFTGVTFAWRNRIAVSLIEWRWPQVANAMPAALSEIWSLDKITNLSMLFVRAHGDYRFDL